MKIIDLTHIVSPEMPVYPGTDPPIFVTGCSIDEMGFWEKKITFYSHTGTHIDAPAHILKGSKTLDLFSVEHFYGKAYLINLAQTKNKTIGIKEIALFESRIKNTDFLLIHTGWEQYWGHERYFSDYPVLTSEAADWLSRIGLKGVGMDTISADEEDSQEFPVHKALLRHDMIIIENLANLNKLIETQFYFSCFPLKFEDADGSPIRAVAYID